MRRLSLTHWFAVGFAAVVSSSGAVQMEAAGYWNLPSSFCQCMGYGWGAGYHAPLVLGPINCGEWCAHNEVRLPYPPSPYCGYASCGYGGDGYVPTSQWEAAEYGPAMMVPAVVEPAIVEPAPNRAIFAPPIEP